MKKSLTIKDLKSDVDINYDVYTKEALISTIVYVRDYFFDLEKEKQQLKEQLEKEKKIKSKVIGHINACGCELAKDECKYLLKILDIDKGE